MKLGAYVAKSTKMHISTSGNVQFVTFLVFAAAYLAQS